MPEYKKRSSVIRIITSSTFLIMIIANIMANSLPINGMNTGQIADSYPNFFAPAGYTFSIWGLIYLLLALHIIYDFGFFKGKSNSVNVRLINKIGIPFSISSVANAAWIISWHYNQLFISLILMFIILIMLIRITNEINKRIMSPREVFFIRIPFGIYFGWITVATIANVTIFLVSIGWRGFGIPEHIWASIILITGMIIGVMILLKNQNIEYGLVLIWAYFGIYIKHTSAAGFSGKYMAVIYTVILCMVIFAITNVYVLFNKNKN
ncbi:MAG: hypothetical protein WBH44_02940 [Proteocatella sp.]